MDIVEIYTLLQQLGLNADHTGFFHVAYAVYLAVEQPELLLFAEIWLYHKVARHYAVSIFDVNRSVRAALNTVWSGSREELSALTDHPLKRKPSPAEFLSILVMHFRNGFAA